MDQQLDLVDSQLKLELLQLLVLLLGFVHHLAELDPAPLYNVARHFLAKLTGDWVHVLFFHREVLFFSCDVSLSHHFFHSLLVSLEDLPLLL